MALPAREHARQEGSCQPNAARYGTATIAIASLVLVSSTNNHLPAPLESRVLARRLRRLIRVRPSRRDSPRRVWPGRRAGGCPGRRDRVRPRCGPATPRGHHVCRVRALNTR
jgi:hypothetical protein